MGSLQSEKTSRGARTLLFLAKLPHLFLTQSDKERWRMLRSNEQVRTILMNVLQSSDGQATEEAKKLTNRLILYGSTHLLDLLASDRVNFGL
jgi:hypothetical protein